MIRLIVASKNPVKLKAVHLAFSKMFPRIPYALEGVSTDSGVPDQPFSDEETRKGAYNRAVNAQQEYKNANYWIGIEGGIQTKGKSMEAFAWIIVLGDSMQGEARTGSFLLPPPVVSLIHEGKELGEADDIVFGKSNSKQKAGAVGLLTQNVIDRASYYEQAVILALIPFKNKELYQTDNETDPPC